MNGLKIIMVGDCAHVGFELARGLRKRGYQVVHIVFDHFSWWRYLKALPLRDLEDVEMIKQEVKLGNVLILKVSPLAMKSIDDVKTAVGQLMEFTQSVGGDIARLGEERVVITPAFIRIWREKATTAGGALPTAA